MATQDDLGNNQTKRDLAASQEGIATKKIGSEQTLPEAGTDPLVVAVSATKSTLTDTNTDNTLRPSRTIPRRGHHFNQARQTARLHSVRLTTQTPIAADEPTRPGLGDPKDGDEALSASNRVYRDGKRKRKNKDPFADWQSWSKYRLWRHTRPLWGSILIILAAIVLLVFPLSLLQFAFLVNSFWASMVIGGVLLVMGIIPLFLPNYAVITGSIGMVLSLVSFITNTFGGLAIGMLLGMIGCALSIAWRPVRRSRLVAASSSANR